jgi:integrase
VSRRRGSGEGSVYKRTSDGMWCATVELGRDPRSGRRRRRTVIAKTKAKALAKASRVRADVAGGLPSGTGSLTLAALCEHWLAAVVPGRVRSPNTVANYAWALRKHVVPALGGRRLATLVPEDVDRLLADKAAAGLGHSSVVRIRSVLKDALRHAERRGLVGRNAAALAVLPATRPPAQRHSLSPAEARRLLAAAEEDRLGALVACGLMLGLRPGELAGLLWSDVDLEAGALTVSGSLKREWSPTGRQLLRRGDVKRSRSGRRIILLPPRLIETLRAHRARQASERLAAGAAFADHGLVFSTEIGTPLDPANVRRSFTRIARRAGLDGGFPYLLRHSAASLLVDSGRTVEEVADLLGDDPRTLYRHYRHRIREAADAGLAMEALLSPREQKSARMADVMADVGGVEPEMA